MSRAAKKSRRVMRAEMRFNKAIDRARREGEAYARAQFTRIVEADPEVTTLGERPEHPYVRIMVVDRALYFTQRMDDRAAIAAPLRDLVFRAVLQRQDINTRGSFGNPVVTRVAWWTWEVTA